jgi:hypothetical protein
VSIQRRLLLYLLLGAPVVWAVALLISADRARDEVNELFDTEIIRLARQVQVTLSGLASSGAAAPGVELPASASGGEADLRDLAIAVWNAEGRLVLTDREGAQAVIAGDSAPATIAQTEVITWPTQASWITAVTSITDTLPTTMTLTISPTLRSTDFAQAKLLLLTKDPSNPSQGLVKLHDIDLICASGANWMPIVGKNP